MRARQPHVLTRSSKVSPSLLRSQLKTVGQAHALLRGTMKCSKILVKERELDIPNGRGVSKLFALPPFAEIKRFLVWQANGEVRIGDRAVEGGSRDALTGFGLSSSFVVFRENTSASPQDR